MELRILQETLTQRGSPWTAIERRTSADRLRWASGVPDVPVEQALRAASAKLQPAHPSTAQPPEAFDWRKIDPSVLGRVKDQSTCRSCAAFAVCSAMEANLRVNDLVPRNVNLSEGDLFYCGGGDPLIGMSVEQALMRARMHGVGDEAQFPYDPSNATCLPITPIARVVGTQHVVDHRERRFTIAETGPVVGVMQVYEDLLDYSVGVYEHVVGGYEGLHAVLVVGYNDIERYWVVRNSWGADMGEDGYVRVGYGQCELDTRPFYVLDVESLR